MMQTTTTQDDSRRYKWLMLALLTVTFFLMQGSRQVFNTALPQIKTALSGSGASDTQLGLSRSAFYFAYGAMVPFAGFAADFFRRKWVIVLGTLLFSTSVFFTGFSASMVMLLVMYGLMNGIGQCMIPGAASSLIAQFHTDTRSTALSIYQSALYVGVIVAGVFTGWLCGKSADGWRWALWIFGGVAMVWMVVLSVFLRNTPALQAAGAADKASFRDALAAFFSKPTALMLMLAFGMQVFGCACFGTWMPTFMMRHPDWAVSPSSAAFHSVFWCYVGSFAGIAAGARTSDGFAKSRPGVRLSVMSAGLALAAPAMVAMVYVPSMWMSCVAMFVFGFGTGFYDCNLYAGLFDVVAPRYRAAAMSIYLSGAFFLGCPATAVLGWVGERFSLQTGFAIFASTFLIGSLCILAARLAFFRRDKVEM